jgi:hypothetical protein
VPAIVIGGKVPKTIRFYIFQHRLQSCYSDLVAFVLPNNSFGCFRFDSRGNLHVSDEILRETSICCMHENKI